MLRLVTVKLIRVCIKRYRPTYHVAPGSGDKANACENQDTITQIQIGAMVVITKNVVVQGSLLGLLPNNGVYSWNDN